MKYDLLLSGGFVIDPRNNVNQICDVAVKDGKIAQVALNIDRSSAAEQIDVSGKLITPGLIDTHAHVFEYVTGRFGLEADMCGVDSGVTTLIDQGGPSCMTLPAFREYVVMCYLSRQKNVQDKQYTATVGISAAKSLYPANTFSREKRYSMISNIPFRRISSEEAPTMTSNSPGSTTQFMFRSSRVRCSSGSISNVTVLVSPGSRLIRSKPLSTFS